MGKKEVRNSAFGPSPAPPECSSHETWCPQEHPGAHPTGTPTPPTGAGRRHNSSVLSCLTPGQHLLPHRAHSLTQHLTHCFGTKSIQELAPPNSPSPYLTPTESPPALPSPQLTQSSTVPKPQGITPNPITHRCAPGRPNSQMFTSHPPTRKCQLWGED